MGTASFQFLAFALTVLLVFNLSRRLMWRQVTLAFANLAFLVFFSKQFVAWLPLFGFLVFGYLSLRLILARKTRTGHAIFFVACVLAFIWLKKYTFIPTTFFLSFPYVTLGLSYIFFRVLHLLIDASSGQIDSAVSPVSYLNYTLNFTTLISGPIQRYQDFAKFHLAELPLQNDIISAGRAVERIIVGFFKVNVLSMVFSMLQNKAIESLLTSSSFEGRLINGVILLGAYPFYLYCNFSGYIDMVIGIARFLRIELPENFNRPFSSDNFMNFWSRWHITLSEWLRTYVYSPLLVFLMRRFPSRRWEPTLGAFAIFITFFLVGIWHGQTSEFLFFGLLQGGGVATVKIYQTTMASWLGKKEFKVFSNQPLYIDCARGLTFSWFALTLLWFWSSWGQIRNISFSLGVAPAIVAFVCLFAAASVVLAIWEIVRVFSFGMQLQGEPIIASRYARTAWTTAMAVVALVTTIILNAPAPDLVYKGF